MRRILIIIVLLAVAGATAWVLLRWENQLSPVSDPWRAVPAEAALVIEVPDALGAWDRFIHTSLLWPDWEHMAGARQLALAMDHAARTLEGDQGIRSAMGSSSVIAALLRSGSGVADPVFLGSDFGMDKVKLASLLGVAAGHASGFAEGRVVPCANDSAWGGISACLRDGVWMLSPSRDAIDECLLQLERGTPVSADAGFAKARATLGNATEARVLVNTVRLRGMLSLIWEPARIERLGIPDGWLAFDLATKPDAILLNGLLAHEGSDASVASIRSQGAGAWSIGRVLPADAVQCEVRYLSDPEAALAAREDMDERARSTEIAAPWMRGAVGIARGAADGRRWFIAEAADPERAMEELNAPCADAGCDTLNHRGSRITRFPAARPFELLLGRVAELPQQPWWTILGRQLVMSDDAEAVRSAVDAWNDGGSLAEQPRAKDWFKRMSDEAAFSWWCDPGRGGELLGRGLSAAREPHFAQWLPLLQRLGALSVQVSPASGGMVHVAVGAQGAPREGAATAMAASSTVLWQCPVGAPVTRRPDLVRNHTNNTLEALVQDSLHRIHLISAAGKLLWSRQLDGPILGAIHQVDRFKNGKLQLLLGTARTAHLIDRNGKDVGLPFKLQVESASPLAVFDYEGTRDYRVIVPLSDGRLLNVDLDWAAVQGWLLPKLESAAVDAVRHLRIAGKDHLLAVDAEGRVKLFDRKGNARESVKLSLPRLKEVLAVEVGQQVKDTRVMWMDQDLSVRVNRLDGETEDAAFIAVRDFDGDGVPEVIVAESDASRARSGSAIAADGKLAFGEVEEATGRAWRYAATGAEPPVLGAVRWAVGDLNLDGGLELVGADGRAVITAHRSPSP
ncbi:MAG: hypothetical protein IPM12_05890 [Flavobacteriales bacterium]|nr:hypothetical protein [Flavobacteriales bacterium]